jgi:Family of unknown function (DUF6460)
MEVDFVAQSCQKAGTGRLCLAGTRHNTMANGNLERFLGGSPVSVIVRLLFVCLLVGAGMAFLGITPRGLFDSLTRFVSSITNLGFDAVKDVGGWLVAGALVVIPVWLLLRLTAGRR